MVEENVRCNVTNPDNLKPIEIVPALGRNVQDNAYNGNEPVIIVMWMNQFYQC